MILKNLDTRAIHAEAVRAAKAHQNSENYLLEVLSVIEDKKLYSDCGLTSLYQYCVQLLHLSEAISYSLIAVIHKSKEVPELKTAVQAGDVTLSKAKKICSVITTSNSKEWIELAKHETSRVIEKCVAQANPKEAVIESVHYKNAERLEFKLGISEEWLETLVKVKDLLSQKENRAVSSEDALLEIMQEFIKRHDPVKKAERASLRTQKKLTAKDERHIGDHRQTDQQVPGTVPEVRSPKKDVPPMKLGRRPIKKITFHKVVLRDQNQCTVETADGRCQEKRWLDIHHTVPVAEGGSNAVHNLMTICRAHHRWIHSERGIAKTH